MISRQNRTIAETSQMARKRKIVGDGDQAQSSECPGEIDPADAAQPRKPTRKNRIRKNAIWEDVYLDRNGQWTDWRHAAKFSSAEAAERFAAKCGIEVFGLF